MSDRRRSTRPPRGQGRQAIIEAVVRVVARQGLDRLTYRAVAAEAGVTHGLVSYHFKSREQMVFEALSWAASESTEGSLIGGEARSVRDFAARLPTLVEEQPDVQAFQQLLNYETDRSPEIRQEMLALRARYLDTVHETLTRLGLAPDETMARLVLAALDGLVFQQLLQRRPDLTAAAVARLQELLALVRDRDRENGVF